MVALALASVLVASCSSDEESTDSTSANSSDVESTEGTGGSADTDPITSSGDTTATTVGETTTTVATPSSLAVDPSQTVIVANVSIVNGAAGQYTDAMGVLGFTTGTPTNGTGAKLETSVVYYLPGGEAVAASVASATGSAAVVAQAMPDPIPVEGGALPDGATVLLMLGNDLAGKPVGGATTATTTATTTAATSTTVAG
jgi:hypothetical protein